jgi:hypothetical protein
VRTPSEGGSCEDGGDGGGGAERGGFANTRQAGGSSAGRQQGRGEGARGDGGSGSGGGGGGGGANEPMQRGGFRQWLFGSARSTPSGEGEGVGPSAASVQESRIQQAEQVCLARHRNTGSQAEEVFFFDP